MLIVRPQLLGYLNLEIAEPLVDEVDVLEGQSPRLSRRKVGRPHIVFTRVGGRDVPTPEKAGEETRLRGADAVYRIDDEARPRSLGTEAQDVVDLRSLHR